MKRFRSASVFSLLVIGLAAAAGAGDLVVDGSITTTGGWYEFADGSTQSSAAYARWAQVAIVDSQGRGDFTSPVTAMAALATWCGTPDETNPCLVKVLPGFYNIGSSSLVMQPYVDIEGSGRNVTYIRAASSDAAVKVATYSGLRWLTVRNDGDGGFPQGIYVGGASQKTRVCYCNFGPILVFQGPKTGPVVVQVRKPTVEVDIRHNIIKVVCTGSHHLSQRIANFTWLTGHSSDKVTAA